MKERLLSESLQTPGWIEDPFCVIIDISVVGPTVTAGTLPKRTKTKLPIKQE